MKLGDANKESICEICGKSLRGNGHFECSKKKQALHANDNRPRRRLARLSLDKFAISIKN